MTYASTPTRGRSPFAQLLKLASAASLSLLAFTHSPAQATSPSVGVSVAINQPGFYGRINIGDQPPPTVIYPQPVIIQQTPMGMHQRPIYLRVPPGHSHNWARFCGRYRACGQPVYFVREMPRREGHFEERYEERHEERESRREWQHRQRERMERMDERRMPERYQGGDQRGERGGERGYDKRGDERSQEQGRHGHRRD
jgi:hypothetical protein